MSEENGWEPTMELRWGAWNDGNGLAVNGAATYRNYVLQQKWVWGDRSEWRSVRVKKEGEK